MKILFGNTLAAFCGALALITGAITYLTTSPELELLGLAFTSGFGIVALINALCDETPTLRHATLAAGVIGSVGCLGFSAYQAFQGFCQHESFLRTSFLTTALIFLVCSFVLLLGGLIGFALNNKNEA